MIISRNPYSYRIISESSESIHATKTTEGNRSCQIPANMAAAVREGWNDRRAPERAAREFNRGCEASTAVGKQRSRPLTYKGGAWELLPKCSTHAFAAQTHLMRRAAWHARSETARRAPARGAARAQARGGVAPRATADLGGRESAFGSARTW